MAMMQSITSKLRPTIGTWGFGLLCLVFTGCGGDKIEGRKAGEEREFGGIMMVWCPPGKFMMGSPADENGRNSQNEEQYEAVLTRGFWLAKYECTQAQWENVMGDNPSETKGDDLPVENVTWYKVQIWSRKMSQQESVHEGWEWALPTEAQWEYACRAGTKGAYGGSGDLDEMGWYRMNSGGRLQPVGLKQANDWGLHDMHGNVAEWCHDSLGVYPEGKMKDPKGPTTENLRAEDLRVIRGGSFYFDAEVCRAAWRSWWPLGYGNRVIGFRPALVPFGHREHY